MNNKVIPHMGDILFITKKKSPEGDLLFLWGLRFFTSFLLKYFFTYPEKPFCYYYSSSSNCSTYRRIFYVYVHITIHHPFRRLISIYRFLFLTFRFRVPFLHHNISLMITLASLSRSSRHLVKFLSEL